MHVSTLLGFRSWTVSGNKLYPLIKRESEKDEDGNVHRWDIQDSKLHWNPGANVAYCVSRKGKELGAPHIEHHCGLNAFFDLKEARNYKRPADTNILGAIAGSGKTEIHRTGFRSEKAQILALLIQTRGQDTIRTQSVADYYSVPVFYDKEDFVAYVSSLAPHINEFRVEKNYEEYLSSWQNLVWPVDSLNDQPSVVIDGRRKESFWYKNEVLHRDNDLPAYTSGEHIQKWYQQGKRHRTNGPAHIFDTRKRFCYQWYIDDKLHRDNDLPAYIAGLQVAGEVDQSSISMRWAEHGIRHRDGDLPAIIEGDGTEVWINNGKIYRAEGPRAAKYYFGNRRKS